MSTIAYAALTSRREEATPGESSTTQKPGVKKYVDVLAALVPSEVLIAHAAFVDRGTRSMEVDGKTQVTITNEGLLQFGFIGLILASMALYIGAHAQSWGKWDFARVLIPPLAFVGWCLGTRPTTLDAVWNINEDTRFGVVIVGALILTSAATALAYKADQEQPSGGDANGGDANGGDPPRGGAVDDPADEVPS